MSSAQTDFRIASNFQLNPEVEKINRAQHGDLNAFNELVLAYQDVVFRQACWILNDDQAAADAAQEAFILAYRKIDTFRGTLSGPGC